MIFPSLASCLATSLLYLESKKHASSSRALARGQVEAMVSLRQGKQQENGYGADSLSVIM